MAKTSKIQSVTSKQKKAESNLSILKKPKICIIHTGGTIGMAKNEQGAYEPLKGHLKRLLDKIPEIKNAANPVPEHDLVELKNLLDSSAMEPKDWEKIVKRICGRKEKGYDGFVVLHGTDTMSYTASALSFLLEDLDCPVILTGSQIPLMEPRNDVREHLITAMILAGHSQINEVCLYFRGKLMRGNRTTKIDADSLDGFGSPNHPPLLNVGVRLEINDMLGLAPKKIVKGSGPKTLNSPLEIFPIATFRLYPGVDPAPIKRMVPKNNKAFGLVLECFGAGNGPEKRLKKTLKRLIKKGVVVVNITQCLKGTVYKS